MNFAKLFLALLTSLDRGKWRFVRLFHKQNCSCCIRGSGVRAAEIIGETALADSMPERVVDAVFQELNKPTAFVPKNPPDTVETKDDWKVWPEVD